MYSYEQARKNAEKIADNIYNLHLKPGALDDGEWWVFLWEEEAPFDLICVHKNIGGICTYDPKAHPAFEKAVFVNHD